MGINHKRIYRTLHIVIKSILHPPIRFYSRTLKMAERAGWGQTRRRQFSRAVEAVIVRGCSYRKYGRKVYRRYDDLAM